jgi:hypothetical protein
MGRGCLSYLNSRDPQQYSVLKWTGMHHRRYNHSVFAFLGLLLTLVIIPQASYGATLTPLQAKDHVGENTTVCGVVASATFAARTKGSPTFLNLDQPYPQHIFTALIWGSERPKFGRPEETYKGKRLCVTGTIKAFRGVPEIVVTDPSQLREAAAAR